MTLHQSPRFGKLRLLALIIAAVGSLHADNDDKIIQDVTREDDGDLAVAKAKAEDQSKTGDDLGYRSIPAVRNNKENFVTDSQPFTITSYIPQTLPDDKKGKYLYGLAVFSDDGCNVSVNGKLLHNQARHPQTLQKLGQS